MYLDLQGITYPLKDLLIYEEWLKSFEKYPNQKLYQLKNTIETEFFKIGFNAGG